jgi:hypothetical protein
MKVNEINKALYEIAFIQNGEYGYHENNWKPSIDESEIDTMCGDDEGNYTPATPLGYRDYQESRKQGLKNIFDQYPSVDLTNDKLHNIKREDDLLKQYDKIKTDKGEFIVVNDTEDKFFIVNQDNKTFYVEYVK